MITQQHLVVPFLPIGKQWVLNDISEKLDTIQKHTISYVPWEAYKYKPKVDFTVAYTDYALLLKYYVSEKSVRANYSKPNDPVYKDSCVELFISFDDGMGYYNFEFNCAGTCLLGFGKDRKGRHQLPEKLISRIRHQSLLLPSACAEANISWELTVEIPFELFHFHEIKSLKGKKARANVYKCGDDLPEPHYLAWNQIKTEEPDFHRPEYFGSFEFN